MSVIQDQQEQTIYNGFILNDTHQACEKVRVILAGIQNAVGLNTDQSFDVHVILSELLQNAIRHGCTIQQNKVYMNVCISNKDMLSITIQDNGKGFDVFKVLDQPQKIPVSNWSELPESGRGLQIVKNLCDDMVFNPKGNCVTVRKKLS
ncbi:MAG: ATP-binding protein [Thermoclostridium sp.]|nr:ATP-binding protein [Thermoclostridium sp.]